MAGPVKSAMQPRRPSGVRLLIASRLSLPCYRELQDGVGIEVARRQDVDVDVVMCPLDAQAARRARSSRSCWPRSDTLGCTASENRYLQPKGGCEDPSFLLEPGGQVA